jgi:hypothetical protein
MSGSRSPIRYQPSKLPARSCHLAYAQDLGGREGLIRGNRLGTLRILR